MTSLTLMLLLAAVFTVTAYMAKYLVSRNQVDSLHHGTVLKIAGIAGSITIVIGILAMQQMGQHRVSRAVPHVHRIKGTVTRIPDDTPRFKIIVNSSLGGNITADALTKCKDPDITHVTQDNKVECVEVTSPQGQSLLNINTIKRPERNALNAISPQGFAASPGEVVQEVAARTGWWQPYAEVIFFCLMYLGVMLRIYWDIYMQKRRGRKPTITVQTLVSGLVIAIVVYGTVVQSGMLNKTITFQSGIFATYNGIVWPVLINDIAALRGSSPAKPV